MNEQSNRSLLGEGDVRDYHRRSLAPRLSCLASPAKSERSLPHVILSRSSSIEEMNTGRTCAWACIVHTIVKVTDTLDLIVRFERDFNLLLSLTLIFI